MVDDLRPQAGGPFGHPETLTPAINSLAERGVAFTRAYCQVSVCSPSRTSVLTGMRPAETRLWTIGPYFRNTTAAAGNIVTLPQALKESGWTTSGAGKVWHPGTSSGGLPSWGGGGVGGDDMPWSFNYTAVPGVDPRLQFWECDAWMNSTGQSAASVGLPGAAGCVTSPECVACLVAHNGTDGHSWVATPCADACYVDDMIAAQASRVLAGYGASGEPFAFFLGLKRPHLGFQVPQHALDVYPAVSPLAPHRRPPPGYPSAGWWRNGEPDGLADVQPHVERGNATFPGIINDDYHAPLRRGYYASVTWMDAQLGKVLHALDTSGRAVDTWVVLLGDHGWSLGEHGNWAKQQLFEHVLRVPLIIAPPRGAAGWRVNAAAGPADGFVELLDLYPTLVELLGLTVPGTVPAGQLNGSSLVPLLRAADTAESETAWPKTNAAHAAAFTQIVRGDRNCTPPDLALLPAAIAIGDSDPPTLPPTRPLHLADESGGGSGPSWQAAPACAMGMSIRTRGWRYTAWTGFTYEGPVQGPDWADLRGEELYDHAVDDAGGPGADPGLSFDESELVSLADDPAYATVKAALRAQLQAAFPPTAFPPRAAAVAG